MRAKTSHTTCARATDHAAGARALVRRAACALSGLWTAYIERQTRLALRQLLHALDDRVLDDLGLARSQIDAAVAGAFESPFRRGAGAG